MHIDRQRGRGAAPGQRRLGKADLAHGGAEPAQLLWHGEANELLHGLPRIPRSILVQRLRTLEATGVIERRTDAEGRGIEYHLTQAGTELGEIVLTLGDWGQRWANVEIGEGNLDPDLLIWDIHRRLDGPRLPDHRAVVQIDLTGAHQKSYWLVLERPAASVCWSDPGFEPELFVSADSAALHRVWMGQLDLALALRQGLIEVDGPAELRRAFPAWLKLSVFAERGQPEQAGRDNGSLNTR